MSESALLTAILQVIKDYESNNQAKLTELEMKLQDLESESARLREELERTPSIFDEVSDELLQARLSRLQTSPLDTIIREAGVVLEDRLRQIAGEAGKDRHGVQLVDPVFAPNTGIIQFSQHPVEQEGVRLLYRGAMQFVRNPPMHNLIDYQASAAQILLRLIDTLLRLLAETQLRNEDDVNLKDIRRMLTRIPIPAGQQELYKILYEAGEQGITGSDLAVKMNRTKSQLSGVLGALGVRINGTDGLQNKGGVLIVFEINRVGSEWQYKMKPILRRALETEKLV